MKPIPVYDVNNTSCNPLLMAGDLLATGAGATTPLLALGAFEGKGKIPLGASNRIPKIPTRATGIIPLPSKTLTKRMVHQSLREQFTVQILMDLCDRQGQAYSVAVFGSGALGCTLSAISVGFKPIWGTEVEKHMRQMWVSVCATTCYGDTNEKKWLAAAHPTYGKSSTHCGSFSTGGMQEGLDCDRGAQYLLQVNTVIESGAKIACLENVGNSSAQWRAGCEATSEAV